MDFSRIGKSLESLGPLGPVLTSKVFIFSFVTVSVLLTYIRIFFGVEITDEAYYVACAFLTSIGGKPFQNDLYFQQTASLVYEPLVYLYNSLFGSTGIMLFVRHLYFFMAFACAASFYFLFCQFIESRYAALSALIPVVFIPYVIPSLGYNTVASLCLGIGFAWLLNGYWSGKTWKLFLAGFVFSLGIFAYPIFGAGGCLLYLFLFVWHWRKEKKFHRPLFLSGVFCALLFVAWWGISLWRFGTDNLDLIYQVTLAFGALGSPWQKIQSAQEIFMTYAPDFWLVISILVMSALTVWRIRGSWAWVTLLLTVLFLIFNPNGDSGRSHSFLAYIVLTAWPLFFWKRQELGSAWILGLMIGLPSLAMALMVGWTSSQTLWATALASQFVVLSFNFLMLSGNSKALGVLVTVVMVIGLQYWNYDSTYREAPLPELTAQMQTGPFAGLFTSESRKELMEQIESDIAQASGKASSILFYDSFPGGYLFSQLKPATLSVFIHPVPYGYVMRELYYAYYQNPNNRPDVFFQFEAFPISREGLDVFRNQFAQPPRDRFFDQLPNSGDYNLIAQRPYYKIWKKKGL